MEKGDLQKNFVVVIFLKAQETIFHDRYGERER